MRFRCAVIVVCAAAGGIFGSATAQTKRALVVGINTYQPAGTVAQHPAGCEYGRCQLKQLPNLNGAVNDAVAMAELLTSAKFGFSPTDVQLLTNPSPKVLRPVAVLPAGDTSRDGLLRAMQKYLVETPERGDYVVFYYAGYGSLRVNSQGTRLTLAVNGTYVHADSTLVPSDAYLGAFDIRDEEMKRIFDAALDKGIHLTVILDSCMSRSVTRGDGTELLGRVLPFDPRDINLAPSWGSDGHPTPTPTERPGNPALVFTAAQQDQMAQETSAEKGAESHGAFTAALIDTLSILPADTPASTIYMHVKALLEAHGDLIQEPDLDAGEVRRYQPLFSGKEKTSAKTLAAVLSQDADGVWLDAGSASGVGVNSEFVSVVGDSHGQNVRLRVQKLLGLNRSVASVITPAKASVAPGDVFELTKFVPADLGKLKLWMAPSNLTDAQLQAATAELRASGAVMVADPIEQPWTYLLSWDGQNWTLRKWTPIVPNDSARVKGGDGRELTVVGPILTAEALKTQLKSGATVWADLPPSRELAAKLELTDSIHLIQVTDSLEEADYILAGGVNENGPVYAWVHRQEFQSGPPAKVNKDHSPGCSSTSSFPVRSDWIYASDATSVGDASSALSSIAQKLAKVYGWLELSNFPAGASAANYYKLGLVYPSSQALKPEYQPVKEGDRLNLALFSDSPISERRWVYVLDIDCRGEGTLLYPTNDSENQFPREDGDDSKIILPHAPTLHIGPPYGIDTMVLLSSGTPLADPYALNFEGVASRGLRGSVTPLEGLLSDTSGGTQGSKGTVSTAWGISIITVRSLPKDASQ